MWSTCATSWQPRRVVQPHRVSISMISASSSSMRAGCHRNKPSRTYEPGQTFDSKITLLGGDEAELGFDYVFVNGTSSSVWIRLHAYDKDGTHITSIPNYVEVPITRSKLTTVRGAFLTASAGGGVGIDPDFDGEDYDYIVD